MTKAKTTEENDLSTLPKVSIEAAAGSEISNIEKARNPQTHEDNFECSISQDTILSIEREIFETLKLYASNYKTNIEIKPDKIEDLKKSLDQLVSQESTLDEYISSLNENKFLPRIKTEKLTELSAALKEAAKKNKQPRRKQRGIELEQR